MISTDYILDIMNRLKNNVVRNSTAKTYFTIWRSFNKFLINLDRKPESWEDRTALYCTFLIDNGSQSSTVKSYVSAIKSVLRGDGYKWSDDKVLLESLIKACRLKNDHERLSKNDSVRLPIRIGLLETILFKVDRYFGAMSQPYLRTLYQAFFALAYYGLMRIGELAEGDHMLKAKDIHVGGNKNKILMVLYTSKTHGRNKEPQTIKIKALHDMDRPLTSRFFCPFKLV